MRRPQIGITMARDADYQGLRLRDELWQRVLAAGGLPLLLTPMPDAQTAELSELLDGLLLSGGGDPHPALFGELPRLALRGGDLVRDAFEMQLIREAWPRRLPMLGICRGMQMLCLALGGALYQDIRLCCGEDMLAHDQQAPRQQATHCVTVCTPQLAVLLGEKLMVNSHHHQAVRSLPACLAPAAYAPDGILEALLAPGCSRWLYGVQWHPEALAGGQPLFDALVRAAAEHISPR